MPCSRHDALAAASRLGRNVLIDIRVVEDSENGSFFGECTNPLTCRNWRLYFSLPFGRIPVEGHGECDLVYLPDDEKPALVMTERGMLILADDQRTDRA